MDGVNSGSSAAGKQLVTNNPVDHLLAGLNPKATTDHLSADSLTEFHDNCRLAYKALIPIYQGKESLPIKITLIDGTPLSISLSMSTSAVMINGKSVEPTSSLESVFQQLFCRIQESDYFDQIRVQEQCYRNLQWGGNFYYKHLPSPEQLAPDYKNTPYVTIDDVAPENFNAKVMFSPKNLYVPGDNRILCRHLSAKYVEDVLTDKSGYGKFRMDRYNNETSIREHVTVESEELWHALKNNASSYDLINNAELGKVLQTYFKKMELMPRPETGNQIKTLLIGTTDHVMMLRLKIKWNGDKPIYVIKFCDPNTTNKTVRAKTNDLATLERHTLENYVCGNPELGFSRRYLHYFRNVAPISMIFDCDLNASPPSKRKLNNPLPDPLTETHLFFLLNYNFPEDLAELTDRLTRIGKESPEKLIDLLKGKREDGTSGLNMAMQLGHADVIKAYGDLLFKLVHLVPQLRNELVDILAAKGPGGTPALYLAVQNTWPDAIRAFKESLLSLLSHDQLIAFFDLVSKDDKESVPKMHLLMASNDEESKEKVAISIKNMQGLIAQWRKEMAKLQ